MSTTKLLLLSAALLLGALGPSARSLTEDAVCTQVTIKINQQAVITRTAFVATLTLENETPSTLEAVFAGIQITDANGAPANQLFGIPAPALTGIANVAGSGVIFPSGTASSKWTILAAPEAAPGPDPVTYRVGGVLSYFQAGTLVTINLVPVPIQVLPSPTLVLEYYLQHKVYSDNPFTPLIIEKVEPFSLGLVIRNTGYGAAKDLKLTTSQPEIVDNQAGLQVSMAIVAAELNGGDALPSFEVKVGQLDPGKNAVIRWLMTSSLQGEFVDVKAELEHVGATGDVDTSYIDQSISATYLLDHVVQAESPTPGDGLPDFLVVEESLPHGVDLLTADPLPNEIKLSEGGTLPVHSRVDHAAIPADQAVSVTKAPSDLDLMGQALVLVDQVGWQHIRFDSPGGAAFQLMQVVRTSPTGARAVIGVVAPGDVGNAWSTVRGEAPAGSIIPSVTQRLTNVLDYCSELGSYSYELAFVKSSDAKLTSDKDVVSLSQGGHQTLNLNFGPTHAGKSFIVLGSLSVGLTPLAGLTIPLTVDSYFSLTFANAAGFGFLGTLDGTGHAVVELELPPGLNSVALLGTSIYHAAVVYQPGDAQDVSNPVPIYFTL